MMNEDKLKNLLRFLGVDCFAVGTFLVLVCNKSSNGSDFCFVWRFLQGRGGGGVNIERCTAAEHEATTPYIYP